MEGSKIWLDHHQQQKTLFPVCDQVHVCFVCVCVCAHLLNKNLESSTFIRHILCSTSNLLGLADIWGPWLLFLPQLPWDRPNTHWVLTECTEARPPVPHLLLMPFASHSLPGLPSHLEGVITCGTHLMPTHAQPGNLREGIQHAANLLPMRYRSWGLNSSPSFLWWEAPRGLSWDTDFIHASERQH